MRTAVAHSEAVDAEAAAREVVEQLRAQLSDPPAALLVFAAVELEHQTIVAALSEAFPQAAVAGCTTDGELSSCGGFAEDSLAVMAFGGDGVRAQLACASQLSADVAAGITAATAGVPADARMCIALPESLTVSGVDVVSRLQAAMPEMLIVGGTAGDQWTFEHTHQFSGDRVLSDALVLLFLCGEFEVAVGVASGWTPLGAQAVVSESEGALVHRIGDTTALGFYQKYLGDVDARPDYPLGVMDGEDMALRAPMRTIGTSVQFAGDVPAGARVTLAHASRAAILEGCDRSLDAALASLDNPPQAAIVFSCAARKQLLGTRTGQEVERAVARLGDIPIVGFYSYGEIAPQLGERARFHNQTFVTVVLA